MPRKNSGGRVRLRERRLSDGRASLYLDVYHDGARTYEFLRLYLTGNRTGDAEIRRIAETHRMRRELAIASEDFRVPLRGSSGDFIAYVAATSAAHTSSPWPALLRHLRIFAGETLPMTSVTRAWLRSFRTYLLNPDTKLATNSAAAYLRRLRAAVKRAVADDLLRAELLPWIEAIGTVDTETSFLTIDELRTLAATPITNREVRRAFLFSCYTGLRWSDCVLLEWSHVTGSRLALRQRKTRDMLYVPLSEQAIELLGTPGPSAGRVFGLPGHRTAWLAVRRWAKSAGIVKRVSYHTSRHTFATLALASGADLYTVSKLLGHRDIATTQRYARVIDRRKDEAVANLPKL